MEAKTNTPTEAQPATMITRDQIVDAIKTCYDPEIPVDIWELGLIYETTVYGFNNIYIRMTLTSPNCPAAVTLPQEVETKMKGIPGANDVKVEVVWDPPYDQSMMSEEARLELGFM
jgi:FeS assembly SUF system protein